MSSTEGERLRAYMSARMGDRYGWVTELERRSGVQRATMYGWWKGTQAPDLDKLAQVAPALGCTRADLVAAMDGYDLEAARREVIAREVDAAVAPLRALLRDAGLLPAATAPGAAPRGGRPPRERVA